MTEQGDFKIKMLLRENARIYSENCNLKHLNSKLASKLTKFKCKVENLLLELKETPQSHGHQDNLVVELEGKISINRECILSTNLMKEKKILS